MKATINMQMRSSDGRPRVITALTVSIDDYLPKNRAHRSPGRPMLSRECREYRAAIANAKHDHPWNCLLPIKDGLWHAVVTVVAPARNKRLIAEGHLEIDCPRIDADAGITQGLDALKAAGIIDDDDRIARVTGERSYSKGERSSSITLVRLDR